MTKAGESILRGAHEALAFARGEDTGVVVHEPAKVPDQIDIKAIRESLGLSQTGFAAQFGFAPSSIRNWEQGIRKPTLPVRAFFKVIEHDPQSVREALTGGKAKPRKTKKAAA